LLIPREKIASIENSKTKEKVYNLLYYSSTENFIHQKKKKKNFEPYQKIKVREEQSFNPIEAYDEIDYTITGYSLSNTNTNVLASITNNKKIFF
jgi:hypothetical protein